MATRGMGAALRGGGMALKGMGAAIQKKINVINNQR
jgi:hypothetical protein